MSSLTVSSINTPNTNLTLATANTSAGSLVINQTNGFTLKANSATTLLTGNTTAITHSVPVYANNIYVNSEPVSTILNPAENRIINGAFDFWQRGTSSTSAGVVAADRWVNNLIGGTVTMSRQSFAVGDALGKNTPKYYLRQTVSGHTLASHLARIEHKIEGVGSYAGQTITVLGWARRSSGTGNMSVEGVQSFGSSGSPSASVINIPPTTVTLTGSWAPFAVVITVPSIAGKTLGTDNNDWFGVYFYTSAGSDFNARTNSLGLQTIGVDLWGIHIRVGTHTTDAANAYLAPPLADELPRCYRYYYKESTGGASFRFVGGHCRTTTAAVFNIRFPVSMRAAPILETTGTAANYEVSFAATAVVCSAVPTLPLSVPTSAVIDATVASGLTAGDGAFLRASGSAAAYLAFDAEL